MESSLKRDISINLGLYTDSLGEIPKKRQSIFRTWWRLSSLQRSVIGLVLVCTLVVVFYILPGKLSTEGKTKHFPELQVQDSLPLDEAALEEEKEKGGNEDERQKNEQMLPSVDEQKREKTVTKRYDFFNGQKPNEKQEKVIAAFKHAWKAYKTYAWGHDELHPITRTHSEWFGTGLTLVDSLDTIIIMGLKEEYEEARKWIAEELTLNVNRNVNLFEITIRVLGSLLTSYHLTGDVLFKMKAIDLGDRLLPAFNHRSKIPFSDVNLALGTANAPKWGPDSSTSEVTTIQLEFRDLSKVTGDPKYADAVHEISMHVHDLPKMEGLVPIFINADTGNFRSSSTITLGARADTYYEYLLKQWLQSGKQLTVFRDDFERSVKGMRNKLIRKSEPNKLVFVGELLNGRSFSPKMDHLACYLPGTLALAHHNGLDSQHLQLAEELANTCWEMYNSMPTKLSPEIVYFNTAQGSKEDIFVKPLDAHNLLRPETVESFFYLYRLTGDKKYREWGWAIFQAFEKYTRLPDGYSSIHNVKDAGNPRFRDKMESFFLAETLKYFYLLFSDDPLLIPLDKYVFNSEAHPLPVYPAVKEAAV